MPDPNTSTRAQFTASYLAIAPVPTDPNVSAKWTRLVNSLLALIKALGEHEAMQRNNQQTYMTPAKDKNAQYFAWDFVGRTVVGSFSFLHFVCHAINMMNTPTCSVGFHQLEKLWASLRFARDGTPGFDCRDLDEK